MTLNHDKRKLYSLNFQMIKSIESGNLNQLIDLIDSGANFHILQNSDLERYNALNETALHLAAKNGHTHIIDYLLSSNITPLSVNTPQKRLATPLHYCLFKDNVETLKKLIEYKASIHIQDADTATPLVWSGFLNAPKSLKILLENGADPEIRDHFGHTCFEWSCYMGHIEALKSYIECKALSPKEIQTGIQTAEQSRKSEIIELLAQYL